ncbi:MAG: radical SAM family heme chaperone HemW, partial [Dokdonella sp.]
MSMIAPPLSLYIHIPWCVKKCPYCDFNSHALNDALPVDAYVDALLADFDRDLREFGDALSGRSLHSIFFGGGTPSLFAPDAIARILDGVGARIDLPRNIEITLETNPGTVEHGRFDGYLRAGVSRLSFGVQSFDDAQLARLGRIHSAADAERAIKEAQDAGFANLNLDLMYALPEQTLAGALADVERAIALEPAHVSHYQLTLEPNTLFAAQPPALPDEDSAWDMQEACQQRLADAGYAQYEVSAYARGNQRSVHNLNYWTFGDYLGIGAGAHGKLSQAKTGAIIRTTKLKLPRSYLERAVRGEAFGSTAAIAGADLPFEFMMNALRLNDGVPMSLFGQRSGLALGVIDGKLNDAR